MSQNFATDVVIIGAGICGLMAARVLREQGKRVILLDKGKSVGGRMSTRRVGEGLADHGAQFFTVRETEFRGMVENWLAEGLVFEWARGWSDGSLAATRDGHPRYAVRGGMNNLPKHLAQGLDVRVNVRIAAVRPIEGGWQVQDEVGSAQRARAVLLTPPVPQSLALIDAGGVQLPEADRRALDGLEYEPCLTGIFRIEGEVSLPAPGAIQRPHAKIYWLADNRRKGISPDVTILTAQASPIYSRQLAETPDDDVLKAFRVDLMPFLGERATIVEAQLKRWKYSQPITVYPERCLLPEHHAPIAFAGDAFGGARVEGATMSGLAVGRALAERL